MKLISIMIMALLLAGHAAAQNYMPEFTMEPGADLSMFEGDPGNFEAWGGDLNNATYVNTSWVRDNATSGIGITVGFTPDCDFVCDGIDDLDTWQDAITYKKSIGGGNVYVQNGHYDAGTDGHLYGAPGVALIGETVPRFSDGLIYNTTTEDAGVVAVDIHNYNSSTITITSGFQIENIYFRHPEQTHTFGGGEVIEYPAIIDGITTIEQPISMSPAVIKNCVCANAWDFINLTNFTTTNDVCISGIRGKALHIGIEVDNCGHICRMVDCQFVPGFGGDENLTIAEYNYIANNFTGFKIGENICGGLWGCAVWPGYRGFWITGDNVALYDCMADATQLGLDIDGDFCNVFGGTYYGFQLVDFYNVTWGEDDIGIQLDGNYNTVIGPAVSSGSSGILITGKNNTVDAAKIWRHGWKDTIDWTGGITITNDLNIVSNCVIDGVTPMQGTSGIFQNGGVNNQYIANRIINQSLAGIWLLDGNSATIDGCEFLNVAGYDLVITDPDDCMVYCKTTDIANTGDRNVFNGLSTNSGNPASAGVWNGVTPPPSTRVYDSSSGTTMYEYVLGVGWKHYTVA